ncbi:MAG: hypothetical protein IJ226_01405 [Clostridia bacterium]|nr:hypothetical protein [Clostridia bacterium]
MAYKVAYISKHGKFDAASEFESFAKSHGVSFAVERIDAGDLKDCGWERLSSFDAVVLSSHLGACEQFAGSLASSLSLYAKCTFKCTDSGNLTRSNLIIVTDVQNDFDGGFATENEFGRYAHETRRYSELEIERTARIAYELAENRSKSLTLSDSPKGSHIASLWRKIVSDINEDYPSVHLEFESTFDTARKMAGNANGFDVILTENANSLALSGVADAKNPLGDGTSGVAYLGETTVGLYMTERAAVGASALDSLSFANMLDHSFDLPRLAEDWKIQIVKVLLQKC